MKAFLQPRYIYVIALFTLTGCISLKKVNDYSSNALQGIQKFEEVSYTFNQACIDKCKIEQLKTLRITNTDCDCKLSDEADSITFLMYNAIKGYLQGLSKISDNKSTTYNSDALTKALKEGNFGTITIGKEDVDAYSMLGKIIIQAVTENYKKKQIKKFIEDGNAPVITLLRSMQFNLSANLSGLLKVKKESLRAFYFDLMDSPGMSPYEKIHAIKEYDEQVLAATIRQKEIVAFVKGLKKIEAGHQQLYDHRNQLSGKELSDLLSQYRSEIKDIVDEFNKLKNQE
jgi:hypothetical protein